MQKKLNDATKGQVSSKTSQKKKIDYQNQKQLSIYLILMMTMTTTMMMIVKTDEKNGR